MKVFSLKKYLRDMGRNEPRSWAKECDGQPVKGDSCIGKNGISFWVCKEWCEEVPEYKLIFKGNETILIKDGEKYVSKCADGDTYDKEKGLLLCLAKANGVSYADLRKMIDGAEDKNKEAAEKVAESLKTFFDAWRKAWESIGTEVKALKDFDVKEPKPEAENAVKEVERPAKVGEHIKIVNAHATHDMYNNGDILKVYKKTWSGVFCETAKKISPTKLVINDNGNILIRDEEYVVLENYKPYKIKLTDLFGKGKGKYAVNIKTVEEYDAFINACNKIGRFKGYDKCDAKSKVGSITCDLCLAYGFVMKEGWCYKDWYLQEGGQIFAFEEVDLNN